MSPIFQKLIDKNKEAVKSHFYIESMYLSHILINKSLKQIIKEEKSEFSTTGTYKLSELIKELEGMYEVNPNIKKKFKKSAFKEVKLFNDHFKSIVKELKFQYPETKIKNVSQLGLKVLTMLNTSMVKNRQNSRTK